MKSRRNVKAEAVAGELAEGQSAALLRELHLLTRDGHLNADARRKLKQVNHLVNLLRPALADVLERHPRDATIVDVGSGKGYLGFVLSELLLRPHPDRSGRIISVEARDDLVARGREMAGRLGYDRMEFVGARMEDARATLPERVHLVTALHACDTATDDAIAAGIDAKADYVAVVPCCQAEVARQLQERQQGDRRGAGPWGELWGHAIHRREFASHLTNVLRALVLESFGYHVTVTELIGWEHSLKNELLIARRIRGANPPARARLRALLRETRVRPKLVRHFALDDGLDGNDVRDDEAPAEPSMDAPPPTAPAPAAVPRDD